MRHDNTSARRDGARPWVVFACTLALMALPLASCKKSSSGGAATGSTAGSSASASSGSSASGGGGGGEIKGSVVKLETTLGDITIELDRAKAPKSVANFLAYVKSGHYNGTIFHRVIATFMIQGGGFSADFKRKSTRAPIQNEADNGLKNVRGTIAMARTMNPHSATAQFFINVKDNPNLDHRSKDMRGWGYTVFGKVTAGMDVVDKIKAVPTGAKGPFSVNAPQEDVVIKKASIVR